MVSSHAAIYMGIYLKAQEGPVTFHYCNLRNEITSFTTYV